MTRLYRALRRAIELCSSVFRDTSSAASVAKNFGVRIALLLVNLGTGVIVARTLAPVGRGEQAAIVLWPALIAGLATMGIPTALNYTARRRPQDAARLYFSASVMSVAIGVVVAIGGALAMPFLLHGYSLRTIHDAQWLMLYVPQFILLGTLRALLESSGEYTRSILGQFLPNVFTLLGLAVLYLLHTLTPVTAALAYVIPGAVLTVWLTIRLAPRMHASVAWIVADSRALLSYGLRSYGTDVITALASQLDMAVIVAFLNPVALGLYTVSLSLARLLALVPQSLIMVLFPHASGLEANEAVVLVARGARISTALSIVLAIGMAICIPILLPFIYGRSFLGAVVITPFLLAEQVVVGLAMVLSQAFLATGRPTLVTLFQAVWLATALVCLIVLVPRLAITGAAISLLVASLVRLAAVLLTYRAVFDRAMPQLLPDLTDIAYLRGKVARYRSAQSTAFAE